MCEYDENQCFYNQILELNLITFFHRGKLLGPVHTHVEEITEGCEYQGVRMNRAILEVHLSHLV